MKISYGKKAAVVLILSILLAVAYVQSGRTAKMEAARKNEAQKVTTAQWEERADEGSAVHGR